MRLDRAGVEQLLPHAGAMCFLDGVTGWDARTITCFASLAGKDHPLLRDSKLPAIAAVEYAAQATALHGALIDAATRPRAGLLAKLSDVEFHCTWFPDDDSVLSVHVALISRTTQGCMYSFAVARANSPIASGRLMVAITSEVW